MDGKRPLAVDEIQLDASEYDARSIVIFSGLEAVRRNPAMYIGSTGAEGLHQLVYELVDNAVDEAGAGHCQEITVIVHADDSCSVSDDGRGIPVDMHPEAGRPAAEVVLTTLHSGGKFEGGFYTTSAGLHGVGVACVNALSEWLRARHRARRRALPADVLPRRADQRPAGGRRRDLAGHSRPVPRRRHRHGDQGTRRRDHRGSARRDRVPPPRPAHPLRGRARRAAAHDEPRERRAGVPRTPHRRQRARARRADHRDRREGHAGARHRVPLDRGVRRGDLELRQQRPHLPGRRARRRAAGRARGRDQPLRPYARTCSARCAARR